jgi:hypothetical protein
MPLDPNIFSTLRPVQPPDLLGPFQTMQSLKTMQLQQQDIQQQIEERRQNVQQRQIANQKAIQAAKIYQDAAANNEDQDSPAFAAKLAGIDPQLAMAHQQHRAKLQELSASTDKLKEEGLKAHADYLKTQQDTAVGPRPEGGLRYDFGSKSWVPLPTTPTQQADITLKTAETRKNNAEALAKELEAGNFPKDADEAQTRLNAIAPPDDKDLGGVNTRFSAMLKAGNQTPAYFASTLKDALSQADKVASSRAQLPVKMELQQAGAGAVSGGGLDLAAQAYLQNQTLPGRNAVLNSKIMNRAAELAKDHGMDAQAVIIARNAAAASKEALNGITKQQAQVENFSQAAEKNMKVLENAMAQVTDLGAPVLNTPIRNLQSRFAGNAKVAALNAALAPVQAEVAKILNSVGGASGGSLTDTSRGEMQAVLSGGATPQQLKAALDIFRKDIANRKSTYEAQIQDLQQRSAVGAGAGPAAPFVKPGGALDQLLKK